VLFSRKPTDTLSIELNPLQNPLQILAEARWKLRVVKTGDRIRRLQ
jgi:hypothetical protein